MKKVLIPISISLLALSPFAFARANVKSVNAYERLEKASFPDVIDLNDSTEDTIRTYYKNLNSLSESERQGTNLLKNLKPILKEGQQTFTYPASATTAVWQAYEIVDRDWKLSPAKDIEGYDASTNTIKGYKYGKSTTDVGSNPYIHALYVNRDKENKTRAWGERAHDQRAYGINQEHIWPKSLGFENDDYPEGARGDLMHLWAGNGVVNGKYHNNFYFGYVDKNKEFKDAKDYTLVDKDTKETITHEYLAGNLLGFSKTFGGSTKVFEPQDSDKGDIARACFYMMARYNYLAKDGSTINSSNPNLEIVNDITSFAEKGYESTPTLTGKMGVLQDLLEWNKLDPVDSFEIHRNNLMFKNFSFNRNPFIDFPQWADYIWGTSTNGTYDSTVKGSANPTSDKIAEGNEEPITPVDPASQKGLDTKTIIIIAIIAAVVVVVFIIIFVSLSKKNKKKVLKAGKKIIKKQTKKSTKSSKKK